MWACSARSLQITGFTVFFGCTFATLFCQSVCGHTCAVLEHITFSFNFVTMWCLSKMIGDTYPLTQYVLPGDHKSAFIWNMLPFDAPLQRGTFASSLSMWWKHFVDVKNETQGFFYFFALALQGTKAYLLCAKRMFTNVVAQLWNIGHEHPVNGCL